LKNNPTHELSERHAFVAKVGGKKHELGSPACVVYPGGHGKGVFEASFIEEGPYCWKSISWGLHDGHGFCGGHGHSGHDPVGHGFGDHGVAAGEPPNDPLFDIWKFDLLMHI